MSERATCLYKYSNALGAPCAGVHSLRVGPVAAVDVAGTLVLACGTAVVFANSLGYNFALTVVFYLVAIVPAFVLWLLIAQFLHLIFGVNTALTVLLFGERERERVAPLDAPVGETHDEASISASQPAAPTIHTAGAGAEAEIRDETSVGTPQPVAPATHTEGAGDSSVEATTTSAAD
jgi:hypothetical protein